MADDLMRQVILKALDIEWNRAIEAAAQIALSKFPPHEISRRIWALSRGDEGPALQPPRPMVIGDLWTYSAPLMTAADIGIKEVSK